MKKWLLMVIAVLTIFVLAACGSNDSSDAQEPDDSGEKAEDTEEETYQVGATQILEHPSLDAAYEGFKAAIDEAGLKVEYDFQSAQNDQNNVSTISNKFVADGVDLIFANSTPSALGALQATSEIPILFTSVTDPIGAGLVEAMDKPGENITGVTDLHPDAIKETVGFIDKNFEGASVGLIYNAGEQNSVSQIDTVKEAAEGTSISFVERTVANSAEVQQAAVTIVSEVDVIYIVTDNTVVSALETVVGVANEQDIPLIVGEPDSVALGGFATYGIDYYTIGYRTGEMAVEILTGEKSPKDIPAEYPPKIELFINKQAAEEQGIEWQSEWDEAKLVEQD
ncbi:BMP family ABC transporter substrate-binding protein [Virgibacillus profundi]|uniref:BMP family ABC transporter substrate-binding protein n=1 Tax=Virgibacillus profundi TaxID=2024555 RepID=A0A2A2IC93_9BACI|nr:ABC transporter substrate-binding protein [Virgibacillus profundi]PAV28894.1 BMP family ABC transporter substrate-binding protein [Virgibacillus profundi]PXY53062.1 BMP family ABC transporter substrate-binding protein [Virgibacillus profundi]